MYSPGSVILFLSAKHSSNHKTADEGSQENRTSNFFYHGPLVELRALAQHVICYRGILRSC